MDTVQLQDSILAAIDSLTLNRIDKIQADKTITAQISKCSNALTREYKLSYNGGMIIAYGGENDTYVEGNLVYVLVPQGDFTKRKTIVGLAQAATSDSNIAFVSSALSDYNIIGKSCITCDATKSFGLNSYLKSDCKTLYSVDDEIDDLVGIDIDELENSMIQAEAVMVQASFMTRLPKLHRKSMSGEFGLSMSLVFADKDKTDENGNPTEKTYTYVIDTNNMSGNPLNASDWTNQYQIFPIDVENFIRIENIVFYEKNFVDNDDKINADLYGDDIFVKNVRFYSLKKIGSANGDFKLSLSMPNGITLNTITHNSQLLISGKLVEKSNNLSDSTTFYWFKEDNRITSESDGYQMYGGAGWKWLEDKGSNKNIFVYGDENRAYENKYMIVAVYKESMILKEKFTIYNKAAKRDLSIESSLGVKFSFDRGIPTLTCNVNGHSSGFDDGMSAKHDDSLFRFVWSKEDRFGNVTIFNETVDELQSQYDELKKQVGNGMSLSSLAALKNRIVLLNGVSWDRNILTYPVAKISDGTATFKCSVYLRDNESDKIDDEYGIGSASITLQNDSVASPTDYHIEIENGDQVFQYSESGVSPDDKRYENPLEIKPLSCHFYDPAGLEVNDNTYSVSWIVPLESSMITVPKEGMITNNANGKDEIYAEKIFPLAIDGNYNYYATSNQVRCIVSYGGQEYSQYSSLTFTKVGENGTNGTDIVAKIVDKYRPNDDTMSAIVLREGFVSSEMKWHDSASNPLTEKKFSLDLYQRNEPIAIDEEKVRWSVAGGTGSNSKYMSVTNGVVSWSNDDAASRKFRNQIVKASITYEGNDYYAFKTVPFIRYTVFAEKDLNVEIVDSETLKTVLYNADGRNPQYNKNLGISIKINGSKTTNKYIVWDVEGGETQLVGGTYVEHPMYSPDFSLISAKNMGKRENPSSPLFPDKRIVTDESGNVSTVTESATTVYVLPNDTYTGEYCNNIVRCRIYDSEETYNAEMSNTGRDKQDLFEAEIYVPICMTLNTYGLKSLNAWDGNHVEINEDDNYILAPQIGAGIKDNENKFTGVVMGSAKFYDKISSSGRVEQNESIGLLGYSGGRQSIFLNAEDGSATFGLPEEDTSKGISPTYTQGQIKLVPNGVSKIGGWRIGSRTLYNITQDSSIHDSEQDITKPYSDLNKEVIENGQTVNMYKSSLPHDSEGIMFSSDPSYVSIKGRRMLPVDDDIDFNAANTVVQPQDSFEIQMNPNDSSIFTVYRHTNGPENQIFKIIESGNRKYITYQTDAMSSSGEMLSDADILSEAVVNSSGRTIGWIPKQKAKIGRTSSAYVIARRTVSEYKTVGSSKVPVYDGMYYYCKVDTNIDENGNEIVYYLPEEMNDSSEATKAEKLLFKHFVWRREAKVGINNNGRFYTNALKDSSTALTIGNIGAYGSNAMTQKYAGATFEIGPDGSSNPLIKFFTEQETMSEKNSTLYITGASDTDNEYQRPLIGAFRNLAIYTSETKSSEKSTSNRIVLNNSMVDIGIGNSFLTLYNSQTKKDENNKSVENDLGALKSYSGLNILCGNDGDRDFNVKARNISNYSTKSMSIYSDKEYSISAKEAVNISSSFSSNDIDHIKIGDSSKGIRMSSSELQSYVKNGNNVVGQIKAGTDGIIRIESNTVNVASQGPGINIHSHKCGFVDITAYNNSDKDTESTYLKLTCQDGGNASTWYLSSVNGELHSSNDAYNGWSGLATGDFVRAKGFIAAGQINPDDTGGIGQYGIFSSYKIGTTGNIWSGGDIDAEGEIRAGRGKDVKGGNFIFTPKYRTSNLISIIDDIYNQIEVAKNAAEAAQNAAEAAQDTADSKVSKADFNTHKHVAMIRLIGTSINGEKVVKTINGFNGGDIVITDFSGAVYQL